MFRKLFPLIFLIGCTPSLTLDEKWAPLKEVKEDPTHVVSPDTIMTINETAYVESLERWQQAYPEGVIRDALLLHEQEHSKRQLATGVTWFSDYLLHSKFRWQEEQIGWKKELRYLVDHGYQINVDNVAKFLSERYSIGTQMITYEDAKKWVEGVINGTF